MKHRPPLFVLGLSIPLLFAQGCEKSQPDFRPISGGFGVVTKWIGVDSGPGGGLYYKDGNSRITLIWPFIGLSEEPMLFTNNLGFFIGEMPDDQGRMGTGAYFAVEAPGPAVDVSEDILKLWAESRNLDFEKVKGRYVPLQITQTATGIQVHFLGDEKLPATCVVNWQQISNIIEDVKRTGKERVIEKPHVIYLKKDYGAASSPK